MKKCPRCQSVTEERDVCHICNSTVTFEAETDAAREKVGSIKYYFIYLLKNCIYSLICAASVIVLMLTGKPSLDYSYIIVFGILLLSLIGSVFKRTFIKLNRYTCTERYSKYTVELCILLSGAISVILAFAMWI